MKQCHLPKLLCKFILFTISLHTCQIIKYIWTTKTNQCFNTFSPLELSLKRHLKLTKKKKKNSWSVIQIIHKAYKEGRRCCIILEQQQKKINCINTKVLLQNYRKKLSQIPGTAFTSPNVRCVHIRHLDQS